VTRDSKKKCEHCGGPNPSILIRPKGKPAKWYCVKVGCQSAASTYCGQIFSEKDLVGISTDPEPPTPPTPGKTKVERKRPSKDVKRERPSKKVPTRERPKKNVVRERPRRVVKG